MHSEFNEVRALNFVRGKIDPFFVHIYIYACLLLRTSLRLPPQSLFSLRNPNPSSLCDYKKWLSSSVDLSITNDFCNCCKARIKIDEVSVRANSIHLNCHSIRFNNSKVKLCLFIRFNLCVILYLSLHTQTHIYLA
ncbi:unnamed protein product [Ilex paraguariensis]|uniref:Uncharacterized protein n=1 Tax=Ilex paraguariensis TaxID=185542 RepID=A0ABC8TZJ3_9AQUA